MIYPGPNPAWLYPADRHYFRRHDRRPAAQRSDDAIKSALIQRLRENPQTKDEDIKVDVEQGVVILRGKVSSWLTKQVADDDAWATDGVIDVRNQLTS